MQVAHAAAAPGILHLQRCEQVGARSAHNGPGLGLPLHWPVATWSAGWQHRVTYFTLSAWPGCQYVGPSELQL